MFRPLALLRAGEMHRLRGSSSVAASVSPSRRQSEEDDEASRGLRRAAASPVRRRRSGRRRGPAIPFRSQLQHPFSFRGDRGKR